MYELEVKNAIKEGCNCEINCCEDDEDRPYIVDEVDELVCADYMKYQEEKDLEFAKKEHADLYVKVLEFFGQKKYVISHNDCYVTTDFSNEWDCVFYFRLFRYFRVDAMIDMLKDMFNYENLEPHNALVFSYLVNHESVKEYLFSDFEIFEAGLDHLSYGFISKEEFDKKLNKFQTENTRSQSNLFKVHHHLDDHNLNYQYPRLTDIQKENAKAKRTSWENMSDKLNKIIKNKDYEKYRKTVEKWMKKNS